MTNLYSFQKAATTIMGKTYELSMVKCYVSNWTMVHAVRELIQNALDSDSPFIYEFARDDDGLWALRLNSEFSTLTPQSLLLGATSKAGSDTAIGSFGEGYKIALLVLTRQGFDVEIANGDLLWKPRFRFSKMFGEEVLVIDESVAPHRTNKGLTFTVNGLDDAAVETIRESCLRMQDNIGAIKQTQYGDILLDRRGKLYVGSLYICDTDLRYGYNIHPKHIRLERDRQTVSDWDLRNLTLKCWYETGEHDKIAQMIADEVPDVEYARYDSPELVKEACYRIFRERNPGALIASSPTEMQRMVRDGMTKTVYVGTVMYDVVSKSSAYRREAPALTIKQAPPHERLAAFAEQHKYHMGGKAKADLAKLIEEAKDKWMLR